MQPLVVVIPRRSPRASSPRRARGRGLGAISWCVEHQLGVTLCEAEGSDMYTPPYPSLFVALSLDESIK